jgi:hypothetical protein
MLGSILARATIGWSDRRAATPAANDGCDTHNEVQASAHTLVVWPPDPAASRGENQQCRDRRLDPHETSPIETQGAGSRSATLLLGPRQAGVLDVATVTDAQDEERVSEGGRPTARPSVALFVPCESQVDVAADYRFDRIASKVAASTRRLLLAICGCRVTRQPDTCSDVDAVLSSSAGVAAVAVPEQHRRGRRGPLMQIGRAGV